MLFGGQGRRAPGTVVFLSFLTRTKEEKWQDALWGGGGVPTGAGLVDGGVDQGPWLQERVGGGVGAQFQRRGREGLACLAIPQEGARAWGGIQGLRFRKGRCVIFRKLEG